MAGQAACGAVRGARCRSETPLPSPVLLLIFSAFSSRWPLQRMARGHRSDFFVILRGGMAAMQVARAERRGDKGGGQQAGRGAALAHAPGRAAQMAVWLYSAKVR